MAEIPLFQVDAFTSEAFKGNPAGVCLLDAPRPDGWMKSLAMEMNLSETAFLLGEADGYRLRWFTPAVEVRLCGHATLASAHTLFESGRLQLDTEARFYTQSGLLTACMDGDWVELNFPVNPPIETPPPAGLLEALGLTSPPRYVGRSRESYLVEVDSEAEVRALQPNFAALLQVDAHGLTVTATGSGEYDFVSRYFGPWVGIDEDPVTGSAHTRLTPYWAARLGKTSMTAYQASRRGGVLRLRLDGERVRIAGQAVTVFSGVLKV